MHNYHIYTYSYEFSTDMGRFSRIIEQYSRVFCVYRKNIFVCGNKNTLYKNYTPKSKDITCCKSKIIHVTCCYFYHIISYNDVVYRIYTDIYMSTIHTKERIIKVIIEKYQKLLKVFDVVVSQTLDFDHLL